MTTDIHFHLNLYAQRTSYRTDSFTQISSVSARNRKNSVQVASPVVFIVEWHASVL